MNKEAIKNRMLKMQELIISDLENKVALSHSMVDLDETDTIDPEDFSHQFESAEIEQLMKVQINKAKGNLVKLNTIDFSPKRLVSQGALVQTNKFNFFIGLATVPFQVEGLDIIGISTESPIYSIMLGKKEDDSFSFCGVDYQIEKIS